MDRLQTRLLLKARLRQVRCSQPSRSSEKAYAQMVRMQASTSGTAPSISGACSTRWAQNKGLILPADLVPARAGGYEHDVRHLPAARRWLKFTKPSMAGCAVEFVGGRVQMFPATPLQYLRRWRLSNRVFADDVELVGLAVTHRHRRMVISQRDLVGEAPSWEELHFAMTNVYGLHLLDTGASVGGYEARAYASNRFAIFDVRPANCVRTAEGDVVPFDVIPQVLNRKDAMILRGLRL